VKGSLAILWMTTLAAAGCSPVNVELVTPQRLERGLVVILPGIEGEGLLSYSLRSGLVRAGVGAALPIYRWGRPIPIAGPLINQVDVLGNRRVAERIAQMIMDYQDAHPGRPVHLVGHSGGGGVAVFTAEALPKDRNVDGLILLSASISKTYDVTEALARCRKGIVNFYSKGDVAFLAVGTTIAGNVDGIRGPSAGLVGFDAKPSGLYDIPWSQEMASTGHLGGHGGTAGKAFVTKYVAPWVLASSWPAQK
jgi:pimeloyl-ACP methyl ester carboxylesterase